uniref:DUF4536 domain-containing protein n=1 Tax=Mesocestoides corti TaxID=53468 RepID=A0A5K3FK67_MESCO
MSCVWRTACNSCLMTDKEVVQLKKKKAKDLLEKQDCLSCKVFGSVACLAMAGYTAYWCRRQQTQYRGATRLVYLVSCVGVASGLAYMGIRRIFD